MKRIAIMLMFSALILFALEFKTTEHVKAEDDDWIVYMTNDLDSLQRDSIGSIVTDRIRDSIAALEHRTLEDLDSASIALRLAARDSAVQVWNDSTSQATVTFDNDIIAHGNVTGESVYAGGEILAEKSFVTGNYTANDSSVCVIKLSDSLFVRMSYDSTRDYVEQLYHVESVPDSTANNTLAFLYSYLIPKANANTYPEILGSKVKIKNSSDDNAPYYVNGTYLGGNHGDSNVLQVVTTTPHGLVNTDIGGEYTDGSATKFYLMSIRNATTLWFLSEDTSVTDVPSFDTSINGNLTKGAVTLVLDSQAASQMRPGVSGLNKILYIDNTEITADGTYCGTNCYVFESYNIPHTPASLDSVIAHYGEATNVNTALGEPLLQVMNTYNFKPKGECVISNNVVTRKNTGSIYFGGMQSSFIEKGAYDSTFIYIPNTLDFIDGGKTWLGSRLNDLSITPTTTLPYSSTYYKNIYTVPNRFYMFAGTTQSELDVGFVMGYDTSIGSARNLNRLNASYAFVLNGLKIYPYVVSQLTSSTNTGWTTRCYRKIFNPKAYSINAISSNIIEMDDKTILNADYKNISNGDVIDIGESYSHYNITPIDTTKILLHSDIATNGKIVITSAVNSSLECILAKDLISKIVNQNPSTSLIQDTYINIIGKTLINPYFSTTGDNNSIIGNAGKIGMTGKWNVFTGDSCAINATSAKYNVSVGAYTSQGLTSGIMNTHVGSGAGKGNNTGTDGVFIGYNSGLSNTSGYRNTYIGSNSGSYNRTGLNNVMLGYLAGQKNTGSGNVMLGSSAGNDGTSANYNIVIGYDQDLPVATDDSTLVIGVTNGDPLISGNMSSGVNSRGVTVDGYLYKKKEPFAKFKRTTTFTPSAADTWLRVPICEVSGLHNTDHFSCAADSSLIIGKAMMINVNAAVKKYVGVNTVETVLFRLVKGVLGGSRVYSVCGQYEEEVAQNIGERRTIPIPTSHMGFAAGDSLWLEMKTTDVGLILKPNTNFTNPASATINLEYLFDL